MKKKSLIISLMLISMLLLTGCGATEKDLENSKNPEKFVKESFESYYKREIKQIKNEEKSNDKKQKTNIIKYQLEEDDTFYFDACAFWDISSPIPVSYYRTVNNYENTYASGFIQNHFENISYVEVQLEPYKTKYNEYCELDHNKISIELKDVSKIENLKNELLKIRDEKEIYAISIKIKYEENDETILISDQSTEDNILEVLNKLKKS